MKTNTLTQELLLQIDAYWRLSLIILVAVGACWLLSLNPSNTANQLLATDANRGRVLSIMLLAQQGGMPLGHLFAGFLTHYMTPAWVLRLMLGTLLVVMVVFLFIREPAIDNMPRRHLKKLTFWGTIFEAITAYSHHPDYPSEIAVTSVAGNRDTYDRHNQQTTPLDP